MARWVAVRCAARSSAAPAAAHGIRQPSKLLSNVPRGPVTLTERDFTCTSTPSGMASVLDEINCFMAPTSHSQKAPPVFSEGERVPPSSMAPDELRDLPPTGRIGAFPPGANPAERFLHPNAISAGAAKICDLVTLGFPVAPVPGPAASSFFAYAYQGVHDACLNGATEL